MRALLDRLANPLHLLLALACTWLLVSSPWIGMYQSVPEPSRVLDLSHVVLGLAMVPLGLLYCAACTVGGRWRLYFPWVAGHLGDVARDVRGMFRGQRPGSEGGGLFATIEGLLLLALVATVLTGTLWFFNQDSEAAVQWRGHHGLAARAFAALLVLHVAAVASHLLDLVRD